MGYIHFLSVSIMIDRCICITEGVIRFDCVDPVTLTVELRFHELTVGDN
jgi:hypothetical protein